MTKKQLKERLLRLYMSTPVDDLPDSAEFWINQGVNYDRYCPILHKLGTMVHKERTERAKQNTQKWEGVKTYE